MSFKIHPVVTTDLSACRHTEHIANSGVCGCSRDHALRTIPQKPESITEMHSMLSTACKSHSITERLILGHNLLPGETVPRPCTAPGCKFGHNPATAKAERDAMLAEEEKLAADHTRKGKAAFSKWRMAHAHTHHNIQPGKYGEPGMNHDMDDQIHDSLHLSELGLPKTPWKYGVKNNASDDCCDTISAFLKSKNHPLDMRRKEDNRIAAQKWFTGERWQSFVAGKRGSLGGPRMIAEVVMHIAMDLQGRGVSSGKKDAEKPSAKSKAPPPNSGGRGAGRAAGSGAGRGTGRGSFMARMGASSAPTAAAGDAQRPDAAAEPTFDAAGIQLLPADAVQHRPTAIELAADTADVDAIKRRFGSIANTLLRILLSFDAYFAWYFPYKASIPMYAPMEVREQRAFDNMKKAIDMQEIFERVSIRSHGSFLPHISVFKVTRDILIVADVQRFRLSRLELHNAHIQRIAERGASRCLTVRDRGKARAPLKTLEGPAKLEWSILRAIRPL